MKGPPAKRQRTSRARSADEEDGDDGYDGWDPLNIRRLPRAAISPCKVELQSNFSCTG